MGAAMVMHESGLDYRAIIEDTQAYCQHWAGKLENDRDVVLSAASKAHESTDYLVGLGQ